MSQDNCFEKNCTGLPVGSKSTAPMPEKVPSSDGSYDASIWRNHTEFEEGQSSRGLLNSKIEVEAVRWKMQQIYEKNTTPKCNYFVCFDVPNLESTRKKEPGNGYKVFPHH